LDLIVYPEVRSYSLDQPRGTVQCCASHHILVLARSSGPFLRVDHWLALTTIHRAGDDMAVLTEFSNIRPQACRNTNRETERV
jgi:hypothetical protein